jgi:septal ring-binding cell division protein DamX
MIELLIAILLGLASPTDSTNESESTAQASIEYSLQETGNENQQTPPPQPQ